MKTQRFLFALAAVALATASFAQAKTFTVKDLRNDRVKQSFTVESRTQAENFTGKTAKVTGSIKFDPTARSGSGRLVIDLASIDTGIPLRNEHMREPQWLDTAKYPTAVFETTQVRRLDGDKYRVTGKMTFHGVTKNITTDVTAQYQPASQATRNAGFTGDVLRLRGGFNLKLADYGIAIPERARGKVAETVRLAFDVYGTTG